MNILCRISLLMLACGWLNVCVAQNEYRMRDTTVTECEGILYDSERGKITGHYDHNENYTFSICVSGADQIILEFNYFHTEIYDEIRFYDGPNTGSPLIAGPFSGRTAIPTIVATSGCLTVNFRSDANVAEPGWRAVWRTSNINPPVEPDISLAIQPSCPLNELIVDISRPVHCDSLYPAALSLRGPKIVSITSVEPINCIGDSTRQFRVRFAPPLDFGGSYRLVLRTIVPYCTAPYVLYSNLDFVLSGCPLALRLLVLDPDEICQGGFTRVTAEVTGGIPGSYIYNWSPFPSGVDTVRIGPINGPTNITLSVSDASGGTATASVLVSPQQLPIIVGGDRTMCQSSAPFPLVATPTGGQWKAQGMYYGYDAYQNLYDPTLAEGRPDVITYEAPNGCMATVRYTFTPLDHGTDDGACPGAAPFQVSGGQPAGGLWTGPNISSSGLFTPPADTGTWRVTYTHPNGCSGAKNIQVAPLSSIRLDTFCESEPRVELQISPHGGVWVGDGILFGSRAWFSPGLAGYGPHTLTYIAEGCGEVEANIFVKEIDAFTGFTACPTEGPRLLPGNWRPAGGTWYGRGIIEPTEGIFDPRIFGLGSDTLTYHAPNGCSDRRSVAVFFTFTRPQDDTIAVCSADEPIRLSAPGRFFYRPLTGTWSGPGVSLDADSIAYFDPGVAGPGLHRVEYLANTCPAYNWFQVGQSPDWYGDTICAGAVPQLLVSAVAGTLWSGLGVINPIDGIFDAVLAGEGMHEVTAYSPEGCRQTAQVLVPPPADLQFQRPDPLLCFGESPLDLQLSPTVSSVRSDGRELGLTISSANLGTGTHSIVLRAGFPGCQQIDSFRVEVLAPLRLSAKPYLDTLCAGAATRLQLETGGGKEDSRRMRWADQPNNASTTRQVQPLFTSTYTASLSDGCSDSVTLRLLLVVNPAVDAIVTEGPIVCHYDSTSTRVRPQGNGNFEVRWQTEASSFIGESYHGSPGQYDVRITDLNTGCFKELEARLPGYEPVVASFSANPNECVPPSRGTITLLDRSRGASQGKYILPDGLERPYVEGENLQLSFPDTGIFSIRLFLENEGGCTSRDSLEICVRAERKLFLPTAFTPNGDGLNDVFLPIGQGIYSLEYVIVDRWGTIIFRGEGMETGWDGTYKNELVLQGAYTIRAVYQDEEGQEFHVQALTTVLR